jgi:hypothetical protein
VTRTNPVVGARGVEPRTSSLSRNERHGIYQHEWALTCSDAFVVVHHAFVDALCCAGFPRDGTGFLWRPGRGPWRIPRRRHSSLLVSAHMGLLHPEPGPEAFREKAPVLRMGLRVEESYEIVNSRLLPTLSGTSGLSSSWTSGILDAPGALFLRISGTPPRGPPEGTRRRPGAARRAAPPDPGTMGKRRAAWTGRGSPPTPASRQPPPPRDEAVHHPPASLTRRGTARAAHAVPPGGAAADGGQDQCRVLDIHTERGAGMAAYGLVQGSRGAGCPQQLLVRTGANVALAWARCAISSLPSRSTR